MMPASAQSKERMDEDIVVEVAARFKRPPVMKAWDPFAR